ncbi:methyl-accepting chemotaxis protein [Bdellovibrio svalbardensis]|uniref:Methyl-accepting chemotaxis protein n=1 Tax=Bdellovibrio svalbardensis TaxID=2972972 RepID=A0ABT6DMP2_9BACT|nr:methyl-accepting chemotaxis protein [Bdellovibrio svalbardensis]MDG0818141.1 methyl-accepting chemotaxis protein [Bdellovibrio svalbardensis]
MEKKASVFSGIRAKLLVLVLLPIAFFAALSFVSILALHKQQHEANMIAKDRLPKTESILLIRVHANALMRFIWTSAAISDAKIREEKIKEVESRYDLLKEEVKKFSSFHLSPEMRSDFETVLKDTENIGVPLERSLALLRKNDIASDKEATSIIFSEMVPKIFDLSRNVEKGTNLLNTQVKAEIEAGDAAAEMGQNSVILLSIFGGIGLLIYGLFMSSKLYSSLSKISNSISETQGQVMEASGQLASASHQASSGSTQAASALEETVASIEELTSMVKINADNSKSASSLSLASIQSAQDGEKEIRNLIESMHDISASSKKIEEIINVIDDIAFQTNLLALNASVEAARAGEHGRGFAVVAEAVRSLSQRSASAAKDINQLIKDSVSKVDNGSSIADRSEVLLQNILTSVKKVADLNNEIAAASSEQAEGISQITKAMTELDISVQQNAQASEEVAQFSEKMAHQAGVLEGSVSQLHAILQGTARGSADSKEISLKTAPSVKNVKPQLRVVKAKSPSPKKVQATSQVIPFDDDLAESERRSVGDTSGF